MKINFPPGRSIVLFFVLLFIVLSVLLLLPPPNYFTQVKIQVGAVCSVISFGLAMAIYELRWSRYRKFVAGEKDIEGYMLRLQAATQALDRLQRSYNRLSLQGNSATVELTVPGVAKSSAPSSSNDEVSILTQQIADLNQQIEEHKRQIRDAVSLEGSLRGTLRAAHEDLRKARSDGEAEKTRAQDLEAKLGEKQAELEQAKDCAQNALAAITAAVQVVATIRSALARRGDKVQSSRGQELSLDAMLTLLRKEIETRITEGEAACEELRRCMREQNDSHASQIQGLRGAANNAEGRVEAMQRTITDQQQRLSFLPQRVELLERLKQILAKDSAGGVRILTALLVQEGNESNVAWLLVSMLEEELGQPFLANVHRMLQQLSEKAELQARVVRSLALAMSMPNGVKLLFLLPKEIQELAFAELRPEQWPFFWTYFQDLQAKGSAGEAMERLLTLAGEDRTSIRYNVACRIFLCLSGAAERMVAYCQFVDSEETCQARGVTRRVGFEDAEKARQLAAQAFVLGRDLGFFLGLPAGEHDSLVELLPGQVKRELACLYLSNPSANPWFGRTAVLMEVLPDLGLWLGAAVPAISSPFIEEAWGPEPKEAVEGMSDEFIDALMALALLDKALLQRLEKAKVLEHLLDRTAPELIACLVNRSESLPAAAKYLTGASVIQHATRLLNDRITRETNWTPKSRQYHLSRRFHHVYGDPSSATIVEEREYYDAARQRLTSITFFVLPRVWARLMELSAEESGQGSTRLDPSFVDALIFFDVTRKGQQAVGWKGAVGDDTTHLLPYLTAVRGFRHSHYGFVGKGGGKLTKKIDDDPLIGPVARWVLDHGGKDGTSSHRQSFYGDAMAFRDLMVAVG